MTNFIAQTTLGPVISNAVSIDKGDVSNRIKCAGAQLKNNISTIAQDVVVLGGGAAATAAVLKNEGLKGKFIKAFDRLVNKMLPGFRKNVTLVGESGKPFKTFEIHKTKLAQNLLSMPGKAKVLTAIMLPVLAATGFISAKHLYKMGQIDQKYTDKAELRKHQDEVIK